MSNGNLNLPIVIQQSGDVSRMQEQVQRLGQQQQAAAGAEVAKNQERQRRSVEQAQKGQTHNRVRAGRDSGRQGGQTQGRRQGGGDPGQDQKPDPPRPSGGVLDVVV